jgi:hypothetical protein
MTTQSHRAGPPGRIDIMDLTGKPKLGIFGPRKITDEITALYCIRRGYQVAKWLYYVRLVIVAVIVVLGVIYIPTQGFRSSWNGLGEFRGFVVGLPIETPLFALIARGIYRKSRAWAITGLVAMIVGITGSQGAGIFITVGFGCAFITAIRGINAYRQLTETVEEAEAA